MWLPLIVCKCRPRPVEVSEKISMNVMRSSIKSWEISARDSFPVKLQKHKSRKSKGCKCSTVPIEIDTYKLPWIVLCHICRSWICEDLFNLCKKMLRQFWGSICYFGWDIQDQESQKEDLTSVMIYYGTSIKGLQKLQCFELDFPHLENCANILVIGGSKRKPIGSISRRSKVLRRKQDVEVVGITRNGIFVWITLFNYIQVIIENNSCAIEGNYTMSMSKSKYGLGFHDGSKSHSKLSPLNLIFYLKRALKMCFK